MDRPRISVLYLCFNLCVLSDFLSKSKCLLLELIALSCPIGMSKGSQTFLPISIGHLFILSELVVPLIPSPLRECKLFDLFSVVQQNYALFFLYLPRVLVNLKLCRSFSPLPTSIIFQTQSGPAYTVVSVQLRRASLCGLNSILI